MLVCSFLIHVFVMVIITRFNFLAVLHTDNGPVYYVDVVNLPVANLRLAPCRGGCCSNRCPDSSTNRTGTTADESATGKPSPPIPAKQAPRTATGAETAREFEERLARMQQVMDKHVIKLPHLKLRGREQQAQTDLPACQVLPARKRAIMPVSFVPD